VIIEKLALFFKLPQPHDVVGANTWLKRWAEGRKGEDGMKVNSRAGEFWRISG